MLRCDVPNIFDGQYDAVNYLLQKLVSTWWSKLFVNWNNGIEQLICLHIHFASLNIEFSAKCAVVFFKMRGTLLDTKASQFFLCRDAQKYFEFSLLKTVQYCVYLRHSVLNNVVISSMDSNSNVHYCRDVLWERIRKKDEAVSHAQAALGWNFHRSF